MSEISVIYSFPDAHSADQTIAGLSSIDIDEALQIAERLIPEWGEQPFSCLIIRTFETPDGRTGREISPTYFFGGTIRTLDDVRRAADASEEVLLSNMISRGYDRVFTTLTSPPKHFLFPSDAIIVDWEPSTDAFSPMRL